MFLDAASNSRLERMNQVSNIGNKQEVWLSCISSFCSVLYISYEEITFNDTHAKTRFIDFWQLSGQELCSMVFVLG